MNKFVGLYDVRDVQPNDVSFILDSFMIGAYKGNSWFNLIPKRIFMQKYRAVAETLVYSNKTVVKVACTKEDPDIILGYSILSTDYSTIHWVYVKNRWRKHGIGRSLVPQYPMTITHLTDLGKTLMTKFESQPIFNPFL